MPPPETQDAPTGPSADIFAFGVVLCEMLTCSKVVRDGNSPDARPFDNPAVERLIAGCLSKDPAGRLPNMQKVLLELRLAMLSTLHAGVSTARRRDLDALDAGIQEAEARRDARITTHEKSVAEKHKAASEALNALRTDFSTLEMHLGGAQQVADDNAARLSTLESTVRSATGQLALLESRLAVDLQSLEKQVAAQTAVIEALRSSMAQNDDFVGRIMEAVESKLVLANQCAEETAVRMGVLEDKLNSAGQQNADLDARLAGAIEKFDHDVEVQTALVENVRTSMAQTDDLVGRVVEAVEGILLDLGTVRS
jgi:chromosome segregation ATPase